MKPAPALWSKLKKLLLSRDVTLIDQGVELVRSLGDATLFDRLLDGVGWAPNPAPDASEEHAFGALTLRGSYFEDTAPATPFRVRAVLALSAAAPPSCESARALKQATTSLSLDGDRDPQRPFALDLAPLAAFEKLERLELRGAHPFANAAALEGHPTLRALTWKGHELATLPDLTKLPALTALSLDAVRGDVVSVLTRLTSLQSLKLDRVALGDALRFEGFSALRALSLANASVGSVSVRGCAALESLALDWIDTERVDVTGCAALSRLNLHACKRLRELDGFEALSSLTLLVADYCDTAWMPTAPVPALSRLSRVFFRSLMLVDAKRIAHLPAVTYLTMANSISFRDPSALASMTTLREIDFAHCMQLTDVSALSTLPLTLLRLHRTCVDRTRLPSSLRKVVRWG